VQALSDVPVVTGPAEALREGQFAGLFTTAGETMVEGYSQHTENRQVAYRVSSSLPPDDIEEHWRSVFVDVTSPAAVESADFVASLGKWLVSHQPISLAVNAPAGDFSLARKLFEQSGGVVYTVGSLDAPALTCQARPQDGEVFGEFPPRLELAATTKFPVIVPSPTAAHNTTYTSSYLAQRGEGWDTAELPPQAAAVALAVSSPAMRGYVREISDYLQDALATNPKRSLPGTGRTALYGLQTTPRNGQLSYIRCGATTTLDELAPHLFPFILTTAWEQVHLSVDASNATLISALSAAEIVSTKEDAAAFDARVLAEPPYNVITDPHLDEYSLVGQFCSTLLCVGHIKSTKPDDEAFVEAFATSPKWLQLRR